MQRPGFCCLLFDCSEAMELWWDPAVRIIDTFVQSVARNDRCPVAVLEILVALKAHIDRSGGGGHANLYRPGVSRIRIRLDWSPCIAKERPIECRNEWGLTTSIVNFLDHFLPEKPSLTRAPGYRGSRQGNLVNSATCADPLGRTTWQGQLGRDF